MDGPDLFNCVYCVVMDVNGGYLKSLCISTAWLRAWMCIILTAAFDKELHTKNFYK